MENGSLLPKLQTLYEESLSKFKGEKIEKMSMLAKKVLLPFFVSPISLLHELNISLHLQKKKIKKIPRIHLLNTSDSVNEQLIGSDFFNTTKFKQNWLYTGIEVHD